MKKLIYVMTILAVLTMVGKAQDQDDYNTLKATVAFVNNGSNSALIGVQNTQGVNAAAALKLYGYKCVRLEGVGDFTANSLSEEAYYTYLGGPQVSIDVLHKKLTPFARVMFGTTRVAGEGFYTHSIGGGLDVNLTDRISVRAIQYDRVSTENFLPVDRIGVGISLRF